ncbi:conserved Plasmodium protein, unknown function [Plasmodium ovale wallikeri]|uniref:Uncharacterized protein n=1 Tax=Plasmodium ovale wallikeri TaxID=864142 RepID=A0A1A8YPP8_PLAOA|nr:conserved Plasmodium protein, unknown function [Plasmodium ovale wallikeri]SBT34016.1 conserved Plasmodium protein, unknown function [Plasmodium ovale wallikeri]
MISIQTSHSSNEVNFLVRGRFVKDDENYFLLAAKVHLSSFSPTYIALILSEHSYLTMEDNTPCDCYLELLTSDYKETIHVQNTFVKIIFLQVQEGKKHDMFVIADEKLNFRLLKFDRTFVQLYFIGNFLSSKLRVFSERVITQMVEKNDKGIEKNRPHINVCKIKHSFLISIENILFFRNGVNIKVKNKTNQYCSNQSFYKRYLSHREYAKIAHDPMQLKYAIIYKNRIGKKQKKILYPFFEKDHISYVYKIEFDTTHENSKDNIRKQNFPVKIYKDIIFKGINKRNNDHWTFCNNINFITYLKWKNDNLVCSQKCQDVRKGIKRDMDEIYKICPIINIAKENIILLGEKKKNAKFPCMSASLHRNSNTCNSMKKADRIRMQKKLRKKCNNLFTSSVESFLQKRKKRILHSGVGYNRISSVGCDYQFSTPLGEQTTTGGNASCSVLREDAPREDAPREDTPREDAPREDAPREEILSHPPFEPWLSTKICFLVHFLKNDCSYSRFVKRILFFLDKEEKEAMNMRERLLKSVLFKQSELDNLKMYSRKYDQYIENIQKEDCQNCEMRINDTHMDGNDGIREEEKCHNFNTCPICMYYFKKFSTPKTDFIYSCTTHPNKTPFRNDNAHNERQEKNITFLYLILVRIKLALFYYVLLSYCKCATITDSSIILLKREKRKPRVLHELSVHIFLLTVFSRHVLHFLGLSNEYIENVFNEDILSMRNRHHFTHSSVRQRNRDGTAITMVEDSHRRNHDMEKTNPLLMNEKLSFLSEKFQDKCLQSTYGVSEQNKEMHKKGTDNITTSGINGTEQVEVACLKGETKHDGESFTSSYFLQLKSILTGIYNIQWISLKMLQETKFVFAKSRERLCSRGIRSNRIHRNQRNSHNGNRRQRRNSGSGAILVTSNGDSNAHITFLMEKKKKKGFKTEKTLTPVGKLTLPLEVCKVERMLNNLFLIITKRVIFLFSFSDLYGIHLTLINYYLLNDVDDINYVHGLKFVRIIRKGRRYEEVKWDILLSYCGYVNKGKHMNNFLNLSNDKWFNFYVKKSKRHQYFLLKNGYINSYDHFKRLRGVPYIDSFYSYMFQYHLKYHAFERMCVGWSHTTSVFDLMNLCEEDPWDESSIKWTSLRTSVKLTFPKGGSIPTSVRSGGKPIPQRNRWKKGDSPLSLEISKDTFSEIYQKKKHSIFCTSPKSSSGQNDFSKDNHVSTRRKDNANAEKEKGITISPVRKEHLINKEDPIEGKTVGPFWKKGENIDGELENSIVVPLDSRKRHTRFSVSTHFSKLYLIVEKKRKDMYIIGVIYDMVHDRMLICRSEFGKDNIGYRMKNRIDDIITRSKVISLVCNDVVLPKGGCLLNSQLLHFFSSTFEGTVRDKLDSSYKEMEKRENMLLSINEKSFDDMFIIKSRAIIQGKKNTYFFESYIELCCTYDKLKTVKDYKYKSKVITSQSSKNRRDTFCELQKMERYCITTKEELKNENDKVFDIANVKNKWENKLLLLDEKNHLHKVAVGYTILLRKKRNFHLNMSHSRLFVIPFDKNFNFLCVSNYKKTIYIFYFCENVYNDFRQSFHMKSSFKRRKKGLKSFRLVSVGEMERLHLLKSNVLYATSLRRRKHVDSLCILFISRTRFCINKYILQRDNPNIVLLDDHFQFNFYKTVLHFHFEKNFLAVAYSNSTVELFYIDVCNNVVLLLDSFHFAQNAYSLYITTNIEKEDMPHEKWKTNLYVLLCVGFRRYCKVIAYFVDSSNASLSTSSSALPFMGEGCIPEKDTTKLYVDLPNEKHMEKQDYHEGEVLKQITLFKKSENCVNIQGKNSKRKFIKGRHIFEIDTLNDSTIVTAITKLNTFLLIGTNNGVVKVYDIFAQKNTLCNVLRMNNFLLYKSQKKIVKEHDQFLLGNNCVYFIHTTKMENTRTKMRREKNYIYKKNYYATAYCEDKLFIFISCKVKSKKKECLHVGRNNYIDEMKKRVNGHLANIINLEENYLQTALKDKQIGEERIRSKNIFLLPLKICKSEKVRSRTKCENAPISNVDGVRSDSPRNGIDEKEQFGTCRSQFPHLHSFDGDIPPFLSNKVVKIKNEMNANNIVLIKNSSRNNIIFLIILSINDKIHFGTIQQGILCYQDRHTLKNMNVKKFVKPGISSPFGYYLNNGVIYEPVKNSLYKKEDKETGKYSKVSQIMEETRWKHSRRKQLKGEKYIIGAYCNEKDSYLRFSRRIVNGYKSSDISNVFHLCLNRRYMLKELFEISTYEEKKEIINSIEKQIDEEKKRFNGDYLDKIFNINYVKHEMCNDTKEISNSMYVYRQPFLKDYNIFKKNKNLFHLISNKYINFTNTFYSYILYSIILRKYNLASFFSYILINSNIFLKDWSYCTDYIFDTNGFQSDDNLHKTKLAICKIVHVLIGRKNEKYTNTVLPLSDDKFPYHQCRNFRTPLATSFSPFKKVKGKDKVNKKKKKKNLDNYNCAKKQRKSKAQIDGFTEGDDIEGDSTARVLRGCTMTDGGAAVSAAVSAAGAGADARVGNSGNNLLFLSTPLFTQEEESGKSDADKLGEQISVENVKALYKNVLKQMNARQDVDKENLYLCGRGNAQGDWGEKNSYITFLAVHVKGSKYHFSSVTEYIRSVNRINAKKTTMSKRPRVLSHDEGWSPNRVHTAPFEDAWTNDLYYRSISRVHVRIGKRKICKTGHGYGSNRQKKKRCPLFRPRCLLYMQKKNENTFRRKYKQLSEVHICKGILKKRQGEKKKTVAHTYDCIFVYLNNVTYHVKEIIICKLKGSISDKLNLCRGEAFFLLRLAYKYVFLVSVQRELSFWVNIKHLRGVMHVIRLARGCHTATEAITRATTTTAASNRSCDDVEGSVLTLKKVRREDMLSLFFRSEESKTPPLTYLGKDLKNVKTFMSKYIICSQKNRIIILKIAFSKDNRDVVNIGNSAVERLIGKSAHAEDADSYVDADVYRNTNLCVPTILDVFKELIKRDKIVKKKIEEITNDLSEREYLESLTKKKSVGRHQSVNERNHHREIDNEDTEGSPPSSQTSHLQYAQATKKMESKNGSQTKEKQEKISQNLSDYIFEDIFCSKEIFFFCNVKYELIEYYTYDSNFEEINDLNVFENKVVAISKGDVCMYEYDEEKNSFSMLCTNRFCHTNRVNINGKYTKALTLFGVLDSINVVSERFLSLYHVRWKDLLNIGIIKFTNEIKHIFENKLFGNLLGMNMNMNKEESILENFRKYYKYFQSFFLIDVKGTIFNMYSSTIQSCEKNYFYSSNRHIEICQDLMLFFQILINGKKNQEKNNPLNKKNFRKCKPKNTKRRKELMRYYFFGKYFLQNKQKLFLNTFLHRVFIYINKKIIFLKSAFGNKVANKFSFELKLSVYNRMLKLSSYKFSDRKDAFDVLRHIYDLQVGKNVPLFSLMHRTQDYADIIRSELYSMKITRWRRPGDNTDTKVISTKGNAAESATESAGDRGAYSGDAIPLDGLMNCMESFQEWHGGNLLEQSATKKVEEMNRYRINEIRDYNDVIQNNVKDNSFCNIDFYHFLDSIYSVQSTFSRKRYTAEMTKFLKDNMQGSSLYFVYFHFLTYMSNNPKMFYHIKKYLHFHSYPTKLVRSKAYYFNMDLLNTIFHFDNKALAELKNVLSLFPTNPSIEEVLTSVSLMSMPFCSV